MESFSISRTFSRTAWLAKGTIASVGVFLLVLVIFSGVIQLLVQDRLMSDVTAAQASGTDATLAIFGSGWYYAVLAISLMVSAISFAGSLFGMAQHNQGVGVSVADCFKVGFAKFLPVLVLSVLWYLALSVATMFLVIPGVILATVWSVVLPALVVENLGVFASFGRSRRLTKGSRLMIFLTGLIVLVGYYIVVIAILGTALGTGGIGTMAAAMNTSVWVRLLTIPVGWISTLLISAFLASLYLETVLVKEGGSGGELDQIFS